MTAVVTLLAVGPGGVYAAANGLLALAGMAAGTFAVLQGVQSKRKTDRAEASAASLKERTVNREDFDSVVDGLHGVIAERTAQYNDLLATHKDVVLACRNERDEFIARIHSLEDENHALKGGHRR